MCVPDIDQLQPYKNNEPIDPVVASLKRQIECLRGELSCYKERMPGYQYSHRHRMLVDIGLVLDDD